MRIGLYLPAMICTLFVAAVTAHAQPQSSAVAAPASRDTAAHTPQQQAAAKLLEDMAAQLDTLRCAENRSMMRATIAASLWAQDEPRARAIFRQSIADLGAISFDATAPAYQLNNERQAALNLRQQILQMVAQRDARLALELLRSSAGELTWVAPFNQPPNDPDGQFELNLAQQIAAQDSQLALNLAEASLKKGLSYQVVSVLQGLREKDAPAAKKLAAAIMERLRRTDSTVEPQSTQFAIYLLQAFAPPNTPDAPASQSSQGDQETPRATLFDARALGELAEFIAVGLLRGAPDQLLQFESTISPLLARYVPGARLAELKRRAAQAQQNVAPTMRMYNEFNSRLQNNTVDEILAWTASAPLEARSGFYQQIVWKAFNSNDAARARQIINDHVTDPAQRKSMLTQMEQQSIQRAMEEDRLPDARAAIARLGASDEQLNAFIQLAATLKTKNDAKAARAVLADAQMLIEANMTGGRRMNAQMQIAQACAGVDPERGFNLAANVIGTLNDVLEHAAALDDFLPQARSFKQGELLIWQQNHGASPSMAARNWAHALQLLAQDDLSRAVNIADAATRPELRMLARLLIVQGTLPNQDDAQPPTVEGRVNNGRLRQPIRIRQHISFY